MPATPRMTPGPVALSVAFTAAGSYTGSSVSLFVNVVRDESAIRYTGKTAVANGTAQTLSALLTDPDGGEPLTGRTVTFTIGALTATATTDANGVATTTVTIPLAQGTGPIRLTASFAGDAYNVPASTSVPVILFQPQSFVIWGGNAVPPRLGDRVNFWGDQWEKQVTGGDYDNTAGFKGWAVPSGSPLALCEATQHASGNCWTSKNGQSFPPPSIERYVSVIVSTSIGKAKGDVGGNIAAIVVVRVDPVPVYANDPGHPAFGVIVAVIDDGAHLFATAAAPARPAASADAMPFFFRHVTHPHAPQVASLVQPDLASLAAMNEWMSLTRTPVLNPAALTVAAGNRRYSFYSPELNLIAETALAANGAPAIAYEYIWFNGVPVAQADAGDATHWTFTDHLGAPIVLTNADGSTYWRAEYEPFGAVYALRSADVHQPLRYPGQEAEQLNLGANGVTEREYNVFRWYRGGWGRYTQSDPIGLDGGVNLYSYADDRPEDLVDPTGQRPCGDKSKFIAKMCSVAKAASTTSCQCQVSLVNSGYETTWGDPNADSTKDNNWQGLHVKDSYPGKKRHPRDSDDPHNWVPINNSPAESWKQYCDRCKGFVFQNYPQYVDKMVKTLGMADPKKPQSQTDRINNMLQTIKNCQKELDECCGKSK